MDRRGLAGAIDRGDPAENVLGAGLGVFDENVEVAAVAEDIADGVEQLELTVRPGTLAILRNERFVRILDLRILVEHLHVGMRRRAVEVVVILLDILGVVSFMTVESEEALLQDRVALIPEGDAEADVLKAVAKPAEPVLVPAISAAACLRVREIAPGVSVGGIVLADGSPGAIADVWPEVFPVNDARLGLGQAASLGGLFS